MKIPTLLPLLALLAALSCATPKIPYSAPVHLPFEPITDGLNVAAAQPTTLEALPIEAEALDRMLSKPEPRRQSGAGSRSSLALLLGGRVLDNDSWAPMDDQMVAGLEFATVPKYFPIGIEFGYQGSFQSEDVTIGGNSESLSAGQHEFYLGPRLGMDDPNWALWAGLGASFVYNEAEAAILGSVQKDDDTTFGAYLHVGVDYKIGKTIGIGLDARGMYGQDARMFSMDRKTSYLQLALLLAFHF